MTHYKQVWNLFFGDDSPLNIVGMIVLGAPCFIILAIIITIGMAFEGVFCK